MVQSQVKKVIRGRYGSVAAFEQAKGLRVGAVRDHLRGYSVAAAERAVTEECGPHELEQPRLKRRRGDRLKIDRSAAEQACAQRLAELTAALDRAVQAVQDLKAIAARAQ